MRNMERILIWPSFMNTCPKARLEWIHMLFLCNNSLWMRGSKRRCLRLSLRMDCWFRTDVCLSNLRFLTRLKMLMELWVMSSLVWLRNSSWRSWIKSSNPKLLYSWIVSQRLTWIGLESEEDQEKLGK